jgi:hypothetical protein
MKNAHIWKVLVAVIKKSKILRLEIPFQKYQCPVGCGALEILKK